LSGDVERVSGVAIVAVPVAPGAFPGPRGHGGSILIQIYVLGGIVKFRR